MLCSLPRMLRSISILVIIRRVTSMPQQRTAWAIRTDNHKSADGIATECGLENVGNIVADYYILRLLATTQLSEEMIQSNLDYHPKVKWVKKQETHERELYTDDGDNIVISDPQFDGGQWYLHGESNERYGRMNVIGAYEQCVTGSGVNIAVVDTGIYYENDDLRDNFMRDSSFNHQDSSLYGRIDLPNNDENHGTEVAGLISAKNNDICISGIAPDSHIAARRIFGSNPLTDAIEAAGLSLRDGASIDIFSNSWGPSGNGETLGPMKELATAAVADGISRGRSGKGAIYVWGSGNGGQKSDSCSYDGYVNNIHTIAVSAIRKNHAKPFGGERCAANMVTAYSKDSGDWQYPIWTTFNGRQGCVDTFSGSSAATPMVTGVIALALEANPNLTWRDVQQLIVFTSNSSIGPIDASNRFRPNGRNFQVSDTFGFGIVDASRVVHAARRWRGVQEKVLCNHHVDIQSELLPLPYAVQEFRLAVTGCPIRYLEHVEVKVNATYCCRGFFGLDVISPMGFTSALLPGRRYDLDDPVINWTSMSVQFWGETAIGNWRITIKDMIQEFYPTSVQELRSQCANRGRLFSLEILFHGTEEDPMDSLMDNPVSGHNPKCSVNGFPIITKRSTIVSTETPTTAITSVPNYSSSVAIDKLTNPRTYNPSTTYSASTYPRSTYIPSVTNTTNIDSEHTSQADPKYPTGSDITQTTSTLTLASTIPSKFSKTTSTNQNQSTNKIMLTLANTIPSKFSRTTSTNQNKSTEEIPLTLADTTSSKSSISSTRYLSHSSTSIQNRKNTDKMSAYQPTGTIKLVTSGSPRVLTSYSTTGVPSIPNETTTTVNQTETTSQGDNTTKINNSDSPHSVPLTTVVAVTVPIVLTLLTVIAVGGVLLYRQYKTRHELLRSPNMGTINPAYGL